MYVCMYVCVYDIVAPVQVYLCEYLINSDYYYCAQSNPLEWLLVYLHWTKTADKEAKTSFAVWSHTYTLYTSYVVSQYVGQFEVDANATIITIMAIISSLQGINHCHSRSSQERPF